MYQVTAPDHSFVVVSEMPNGHYVEAFKIDQALALPKKARNMENLRNQIEQHLHRLHCQTGLNYRVIYEGNPEMAEAVLKAEQDCPF